MLFRWSAALLGAQQATRLALGPDALDEATPLTAGALLLAAELAWWSIEPRVPAWWDLGVVIRRALVVVFACFFSAVLAGVVLVAAGTGVAGGVGLELLGVAAATAALVIVAVVARTHRFG